MKNFFLLIVTLFIISISSPVHAEQFVFCTEDLLEEEDSQDNSTYFELLFGGNFLVGSSGTEHFKRKCCDRRFRQSQSHHRFPHKNRRYRYDNGYLASGALGYRWCHGIRWEFEYAYRWNKFKEIKDPCICDFPGCFFPGCTNPWHREHSNRRVEKLRKNENYRCSSLMVNLLWDIPLEDFGICPWVTPIFGVGAGYDLEHAFEKSKNGFAWQVIVGAGYRLTPDMNVSIEYKWHGGPITYIFNHSIGLGITYTICND